jgi:cytochrome c6
MKKLLLTTSLFCVLNVEAQQVPTTVERGRIIFQQNCVRCHGYDGKLGKWGAKNLQVSRLNDAQLLKIISNGRWFMPKWKKVLGDEEIAAVITYVKSMRVTDINK